LIVNSPLGPQYSALIQTTAEVRIGSIGPARSLEHWINDGLMAIFFLPVGLEIKREVTEGSLAGVQNPGDASRRGIRRPCHAADVASANRSFFGGWYQTGPTCHLAPRSVIG
jgi:Na+/H+ antiporter NhaA